MIFSDFAPFGLFQFGGEESPAEPIYRAYVDASPPNATDDPHQEATFFARAIGQALSAATLERAANQAKPAKAFELIELLEEDFGVDPLPGDSLTDRHGRLVATAKLATGNLGGNFHAAMRDMLGADFKGLHIAPADAVETWPATPGAAPMHCADVRVPPRDVVLDLPIATLGTAIELPYHNLDAAADEQVLVAGDVIVVDGGNTGLAEKVTVTLAGGVAGARTFTATFTKPHADQSIATTADWPMTISTKRMVYVVVSASIVADPTKRAAVDRLCARMLRGATQWAIVAPSYGFLFSGPWILGTTPMGTVPVERFYYTPS